MGTNLSSKTDQKWTKTIQATDATSAPIYLPGFVYNVSAGLSFPSGGAGKVQHSLADRTLIEADPNAVQWFDWDSGDVVVATSAALQGAATAVRLVASGGPVVLEVAGERK